MPLTQKELAELRKRITCGENKVIFESDVPRNDLVSYEFKLSTGRLLRVREKTNFSVYKILK